MELNLDSTHLKNEFKGENPIRVKFHMFTEKAQAAITAVGHGTFRTRSYYNRVYPP